MTQWTNYWRIVTPPTRKSQYETMNTKEFINQNSSGYGDFSAANWYSHVIKSSSERIQKYRQYDNMDISYVNRALDIISEEISNSDKKTGLAFEIEYLTEQNEKISDSTVTTLRAALRHWGKILKLNKKIFNTARIMIKYGDCFFVKTSDTQNWKYVAPNKVVGVEIDEAANIVAYHIKSTAVKTSKNINDNSEELTIYPASAVIHFSLADDTTDTSPFGLSILAAAFKDYQKLTMLEDASVIYRIVRAPERRVFYIDVGNTPPQRVKQYLEQIKNDIRQRRQPSQTQSGQTDSGFNAECLALDTCIPLLDGRTLQLSELISEHAAGKKNWIYSCDPVTGNVLPGEISWAGVTRKNAEVCILTLDSGEKITCTPDHKFPVLGKGFVRADELTSDMSLAPFTTQYATLDESTTSNEKVKGSYEQIYDVALNKWVFTHRLVATAVSLKEQTFSIDQRKTVIHHSDFNRYNNSPDNLVKMGFKDHFLMHATLTKQRFDSLSEGQQQEQLAALNHGHRRHFDTIDTARIESDLFRAKAIASANSALGKKHTVRRKATHSRNVNQQIKIDQTLLSLLIDKIKSDITIRRTALIEWMKSDEKFVKNYTSLNNVAGRKSIPSWTTLAVIQEKIQARNFAEFKYKVVLSNHKVVKVERGQSQDTGCITVGEGVHKHHTFALASGIFTKNSIQEDYFFASTANGRGSRVETIPGGANWEIPELDYFLNNVLRALRVPSSYMRGQDGQGAQYNDGKVGIAYIEELRFANYIQRLQANLDSIYDVQFKIYLKTTGINIDPDLFRLKLPAPQNFALYRQAALDADLINSFNSIKDVEFLSKRFMLSRYLGLTEDEIQMNEALLKQERSIEDDPTVSDLQQIYDPQAFDNREKVDTPMPDAPTEEPPAEEAPDESGMQPDQ